MAKPYRNNAGIVLFNTNGLVFIARRFRNIGPEVIEAGFEWQMPQGGIKEGEKPYDAAVRELEEETGVKSPAYLGETEWFTYEFPPYDGPSHYLADYRGQRQKWFALRFTGQDSEIDVTRAEADPEFICWRWEQLNRVPSMVISFKQGVYRKVVGIFSKFASS